MTTITVPRVQSLLAYLVLHRTAPQNRSHLAFLLWPDSTEAQAHTNLRQLLYHLRQSLPNAEKFLLASKQSLQWLPTNGTFTLDILDVEKAIAQAEQAEQAQDTAAMQQALEQVLDLYRGDLLPGCYDEWILPEREHIRQLFFSAAERLITLLEQEREYAAAIQAAQQLLRHDPLHEATYRKVMRFSTLRGDHITALRTYHTCITILERELATGPSEATRQAYEALVQIDTSSVQKQISASVQGMEIPLIGRKQEWGHLQAAWRRAASGSPSMIVLSGEAGIGKTKMAEELLNWVSRQGMTTASARCYAIEGRLAYAPMASWLRADAVQAGFSDFDPLWLTEVARLVPDLLISHSDLPHPRPMKEAWQRQHFFEAIAHALLKPPQPLLLLLDDLQWCDNETLAWVHYLLRFRPKARLLLVGTIRSEEILPGHPLVTFLSALQRDSLMTEVAIGPLSTPETTALAEHIMGHHPNPAAISLLYRETEGNPLFVVEMIRAGSLAQRAAKPDVADTPHPLLTQPASTLPPTMQTVLAARLAQLSPSTRKLADLAAVIGRAFSFALLACASSGSEESLVQELDELCRRHIVREKDMGEIYEFSHDKLREEAYTEMSGVHRRFLHHRVAEALIKGDQSALDVMSSQIAFHYEHAGLLEQAIPYYQRAAKIASQIYANEEAIIAFQQAIQLLEASIQKHVSQELQWDKITLLYKDMGDVFERIGRLQEARQAYQCAMSYTPEHEYVWQARLQRKNASTWQEGPANSEGFSHMHAIQGYKEAGRLLERASVELKAGWQQEWIQLQLAQLFPLRSSVDEMTIIIEKAQPIVEQYGTATQRGQFYLAVCLRDAMRDRYVVSEKTVLYCRNALAVIQQTEDRNSIGFAHLTLGGSLLWSGHIDEAATHLHEAMRVGEQVGDATLCARCLTFLPFIYRQYGEVEEVRKIVTRALVVPETRKNPVITGHRAWLAWRDDDRSLAESYGRSLLEDRQHQQQVNSFYWTGLWPLIGVVLAQEKLAEAIDYVHILLEPTQQPPSKELAILLEVALREWDAGQQQQAHSLLQQAIPLAEKQGYL